MSSRHEVDGLLQVEFLFRYGLQERSAVLFLSILYHHHIPSYYFPKLHK